MKKLICLLLVIFMICPLLVGCVWQDNETRMKKAYLRKFEIKDKEPEDVIIDYDGGTYNGARIVMLDAEWHDPEEWTETIGDTSITYYDSNRILVYKFGKLYTLEEAKKRFILSQKQIKSIAEKFNSDISHFRDTCDKHDFDEFQYIDNFHDGEEGQLPVSNMIVVAIDKRVCMENDNCWDFDKIVVEYLGTDIISKLTTRIIWTDETYCTYYLRTVSDGLENIPLVFERLKQVPGVLYAGYYWDWYDPGSSASNAQYYSNNINWGLSYIEVEKVWEFKG